MEFNQLISEARERQGMTQRELSELMGVTNSTVSLWESGSKVPGMATRAKLADILGVPAEKLVPEVHHQPLRTVSIGEQDLILVVDCFRQLTPELRQSVTLTMQILASAARMGSSPAPVQPA